MSNLLDPEHIDAIIIDVPDESWKEIIELQYTFWSKVAQLVGYRNLRHVEEREKRVAVDWEKGKISVVSMKSNNRLNMSPINDIDFWRALCSIRTEKKQIKGNDESRKLDLTENDDDDVPF